MAKKQGASEKKVKDWQTRIARAVKIRDEWSEQFKVHLSRAYFCGKQNPGYPPEEWITINKIYSNLETLLPQLYGVDPYFYVKLKKSYNPTMEAREQFEQKGRIRQAYLNYLKGELKLKPKARLGIQDAHFAYGVMKVHFTADEVENEDKGKPILSDNEEPLIGENGEPLVEPDTIPINERYNISRIHPDDFVFGEECGTLEDKWTWLAEKIRMTRAEAEKDPRMTRAILKQLKPSEKQRDKNKKSFASLEDGRKKAETDIFILWEVYDLRAKKWFIIPDDGEFYIKDEADIPKGTEGHPYSILRFTLQDDTPYPIPPVSQAIDPQREYCLSRSMILTHRKRFNRKYEVNTAALEDADVELAKLENGDDGTIIRVMQTGAVQAIQDAPLDQQRYVELNYLNNDIVEMFGVPDQARGIASADSATEADIMDRRMEVREGDRMSLVVDWITEIAEKLDKIVQANITREEAVRIVGPEGEMWQLVRPDDYSEIEGEYEYSVNVGSTIPRLPNTERASWMQFLQTLAAFPQLMTQKNIMKRMAEMHHIEDQAMIDEFFMLGQQIMSGQMPAPGQTNQPGQMNPMAMLGGIAGGPLGGNVNGAAAQGGMMGGS